MTQHDAFTQGFQDTARAHYGAGSDVLSELDAINQRAKEYEAKKRSAVTPYQPGTVIEYAPPPPYPTLWNHLKISLWCAALWDG